MDEQAKIAPRDEPPITETRAEWRRPQWRKVEAGEAETGFNAGTDYGFS